MAASHKQKENYQALFEKELVPLVKKIDHSGLYPLPFLQTLGRHDAYKQQDISDTIKFIELSAYYCATTAFNLWCHFTAMMYVRNSDNTFLKQMVLPLLEQGQQLGATGLSNPMKFYADLEPIRVNAVETADGYVLNGTLPFISNLADDHFFAMIAETDTNKRVMFLLPCELDGIERVEKGEFIGLNGTATYTCCFKNVHVPSQWIIANDADTYVEKIRSEFVLYQIGLTFGLIQASIDSINKKSDRQNGANHYLAVQTPSITDRLAKIKTATNKLANARNLETIWQDVVRVRLDAVELTLDAVHAEMLHCGGVGYLKSSPTYRRLREAYFIANLTPTVKHLEKLISGF